MKSIEQEAIRLIRQKMKEKGLNSSQLSKKMGMHPSSVSKMLKEGQLRLNRLSELSVVLEFNLLRALADQLELNNPPKHTLEEATRVRLRELEIENATLLKVLSK
ncbi:helix-turn-helix domain-containing protein [Gaoshiqia sediminis]|uniref:Helix-turn-helix transcriptional regulator n=1 Tax=Gaoshiqia sediminis TaxID=2986998 RepID=A0AA41Y2W8_9BACT|nr:helix-turn-helix domain-containing protein [Gaoshiqia sediminis]MCW0482451.1 helix-turn-helix transcriptional regulator [Gaoshiqia sediminis]